jgi:rhodanese-related sulfurtransferase
MSHLLLLSVLCAGALCLTGCRQPAVAAPQQAEAAPDEKPVYRRITAKEAKDALDQDKDKVIKLLDVRTEEEHLAKRIAGSILAPVDDIEKLAPTLLPDKAQKILVYCRSGRRSRIAAEALLKMGYTNVYDFGGLNDWPYETIAGK